MSKYRELPNALHLAGLNCFKCKEPDTCRIVQSSHGLFIATCEKCLHVTRATRRIYDLLAMFAFSVVPIGTEK